MKHAVPHDLDIGLARKATDAALQSYKERFSDYNPQVSWRNDTHAEVEFSAKGIKMTGQFELKPTEVLMEMKVPLALRLFQKKAIDVIEREIKKWLEKARNGEFDEADG
jgi:hypothetical protein